MSFQFCCSHFPQPRLPAQAISITNPTLQVCKPCVSPCNHVRNIWRTAWEVQSLECSQRVRQTALSDHLHSFEMLSGLFACGLAHILKNCQELLNVVAVWPRTLVLSFCLIPGIRACSITLVSYIAYAASVPRWYLECACNTARSHDTCIVIQAMVDYQSEHVPTERHITTIRTVPIWMACRIHCCILGPPMGSLSALQAGHVPHTSLSRQATTIHVIVAQHTHT